MGQMRHIKKYYQNKARKNRRVFTSKELLKGEPFIRTLMIIWIIFLISFVTASMQSCVTQQTPAMTQRHNDREYIRKFYRDADRRRRSNQHYKYGNNRKDNN